MLAQKFCRGLLKDYGGFEWKFRAMPVVNGSLMEMPNEFRLKSRLSAAADSIVGPSCRSSP